MALPPPYIKQTENVLKRPEVLGGKKNKKKYICTYI